MRLFAIDECKVLCVWPVEVNKCKISNSKKNTQYFYVNIVTALFTSTNIILFLYFFYIFKSRVRLIRCIQCSIFDTFVSICTLCFIPTLLTAKLYKSVTQVKKNYIQTCFIFSSICSASPWTGGSESWSFSQWTRQLLGDHDGVECRVRLWDLSREVPAEFRQRDWNSRDFSILFPHRKSWKSKYYRSFI